MKLTIKRKLSLFCALIMLVVVSLSSITVAITERRSVAQSFTDNITRESQMVDTSIGLFLKGAENLGQYDGARQGLCPAWKTT